MVRPQYVGSVCAQEHKVLGPEVELRPRNAKMDAFIRTVRSSPRYDVTNVASSVREALEMAREHAKAHA